MGGTQGEPHQCCCHTMPCQHAASHRSIPHTRLGLYPGGCSRCPGLATAPSAQGDVLQHHPPPVHAKHLHTEPCSPDPAREGLRHQGSDTLTSRITIPGPESSRTSVHPQQLAPLAAPYGTQLPSLPTTQSAGSERSLNLFSCKTDSWTTPVISGE